MPVKKKKVIAKKKVLHKKSRSYVAELVVILVIISFLTLFIYTLKNIF